MWFIRWCDGIYCYLVLIVYVVIKLIRTSATHTYTNKDQIIIYAATPPNEPHQCIVTHIKICTFSKAQIETNVVIAEDYNVTFNNKELIFTTEYLTL